MMDIIQRKNEENLKNSIAADMMRNQISFETKTDLQNFYSGQSLFITGATGKLLLSGRCTLSKKSPWL